MASGASDAVEFELLAQNEAAAIHLERVWTGHLDRSVNRLAGGTRADAQGNVTSYLYDTQGLTIRSYEPFGPQTTTYLYDSRGNHLIGAYDDQNGTHGFFAPIPEPSTWCLLLAAAGCLVAARQFRQQGPKKFGRRACMSAHRPVE